MRNDKYDIPLQLERNSRSGFSTVMTNAKITKLQMTNVTNAKWQNNKWQIWHPSPTQCICQFCLYLYWSVIFVFVFVSCFVFVFVSYVCIKIHLSVMSKPNMKDTMGKSSEWGHLYLYLSVCLSVCICFRQLYLYL